jgi:hypothetical protein
LIGDVAAAWRGAPTLGVGVLLVTFPAPRRVNEESVWESAGIVRGKGRSLRRTSVLPGHNRRREPRRASSMPSGNFQAIGSAVAQLESATQPRSHGGPIRQGGSRHSGNTL